MDKGRYRKKLDSLLTIPNPGDVAWLNEVAGTYLRIGEAQKAVDLLAPRESQFANDYGLQANLGTAYHLLGRYQEAEQHIARDLEINPEAHFGLEKFHLALLQYLVRDMEWKKQRVYVDEFSYALQHSGGARLAFRSDSTRREEAEALSTSTNTPNYRTKWDLAVDPKLTEGLSYMALLNPSEPAAFEMLGILCWRNRDLNLAASAFERAIILGSPKGMLLRDKVHSIRKHIAEAKGFHPAVPISIVVIGFGLIVFLRRAQNRRTKPVV